MRRLAVNLSASWLCVFALAVLLGLGIPGAPAGAQSLSDAWDNVTRDLGDLVGTSDERREMIRRSERRNRVYRRRFKQDAPNVAPPPRLRPTEEEIVASREQRLHEDGEGERDYGQRAFAETPREAEEAEIASVGQGRRGAAVDPLVALLGPESPAAAPERSAARGDAEETPKAAVSMSQDAAVEARSIAAAAREKAAAAREAAAGAPAILKEEPASEPLAPESAVVETPETVVVEKRTDEAPRVEAPRVAAVQATALDGVPGRGLSPAPKAGVGSSIASDPTLRITLAFLVGACLLGLAVLREWRIAVRSRR